MPVSIIVVLGKAGLPFVKKQNPLTAGLVKRMEDWEYSSFKDYAGLRGGDLCRKDLAILYCNYREEDFMPRSYEMVEQKISRLFQ